MHVGIWGAAVESIHFDPSLSCFGQVLLGCKARYILEKRLGLATFSPGACTYTAILETFQFAGYMS